jgi:hypothetical protein
MGGPFRGETTATLIPLYDAEFGGFHLKGLRANLWPIIKFMIYFIHKYIFSSHQRVQELEASQS